MSWTTKVEIDGSGKRTGMFHRSNLVTIGAYWHPYDNRWVRDKDGLKIACPICLKEAK